VVDANGQLLDDCSGGNGLFRIGDQAAATAASAINVCIFCDPYMYLYIWIIYGILPFKHVGSSPCSHVSRH
jgi:hypothetical protein